MHPRALVRVRVSACLGSVTTARELLPWLFIMMSLTTHNGSTVALLSLVLCAPACGGGSEISCPVAVDSYCSSNSAAECADQTWAPALAHACAASGLGTTHGFDQCGGYDILSEQSGNGPITTRYYAQSDGMLVAIATAASSSGPLRCVAGPPTFDVPSCGGSTGTPCQSSGPQDAGGAVSGPQDSSSDYGLCDCSAAGACPDPINFERSNCEGMPFLLGQGVISRVFYGDNCWGFEQKSGDMLVDVFYLGSGSVSSTFVAKTWKNVSPIQGPWSAIGADSGACGLPCGSVETSREFVCGDSGLP